MEYVIRLVNDTQNKAPSKAVSGGNGQESVGGEISSEAAGNGQQYVMGLAKRFVSVGAIVNTIDQFASYEISQISLDTGAHEYGQRVSYIYQKAGGFVKSVAMGAVAGSAAGPVGALVGAAVAAVSNVVSNVVSMAYKKDQISRAESLEDISRSIRTSRATVSGRRYSNTTEY